MEGVILDLHCGNFFCYFTGGFYELVASNLQLVLVAKVSLIQCQKKLVPCQILADIWHSAGKTGIARAGKILTTTTTAAIREAEKRTIETSVEVCEDMSES